MPMLKGVVSVALLILNTLFWGIPLTTLTLVKLLTPAGRLRKKVQEGINRVALNWIGVNLWWMRHWIKPQLNASLPDNLRPDQWWLVISNHRSWTDIFMLLLVLHRRIPMPRFFIKRQLLWIPVVGLAFWALEFPIMRRITRAQIAQNPALATLDREATERMCARARQSPIAIFNFVEGTRFTPHKHALQQSPYRHLLRPKAGGVAQVLNLLGDKLDGILDVTLSYENPTPSFWGFLCGQEAPVMLKARILDVPQWMLTANYHAETQHKEHFHTWINALWQEKDCQLDGQIDHA